MTILHHVHMGMSQLLTCSHWTGHSSTIKSEEQHSVVEEYKEICQLNTKLMWQWFDCACMCTKLLIFF